MFLTFNGTIVAVIINFLLMLWIIKRFLFKPVSGILEARQNKIRDELEGAARALQEAKIVRQDAERLLQEARTEGQILQKKAMEESEHLRLTLQEQIQKEVDAIKTRAQADLVLEKEALVRQMRHDACSIALLVAEKVLEKSMDPALQEKLLRQTQRELETMQGVLA